MRRQTRAAARAASTLLLLAVAAFAASACEGPWTADTKAPDPNRGPKLVRTIPEEDGTLDVATRHVVLEFDRELDTGAQLVVEFGRTDVTAGVPELSADRRRLETDVDAEDSGTYRVT